MTAATRLLPADDRAVGRVIDAATGSVAPHAQVGVWGVKGGVGTTTVALLAGLALARHQPGPILVADATLYGSLALRAGMVLPAEPVCQPGGPDRPDIVIGQPAPPWTAISLLDASPPETSTNCEITVVSACVDAVLMARDHGAPLVALTHLNPTDHLNIDAARRRLTDDGARLVELPFDAHLAVGGPIAWDRLAPASRDATRRLAAALITTLREQPAPGVPLRGDPMRVLAQVQFTPDASALPGKAMLDAWVNALGAFGLAIALGALIVSAVVWATGANSQNYQYVHTGKRGVLYSVVAAVLIGGSGGLVNFFFNQGVAGLN